MMMPLFAYLETFFHEHSPITGLQGKGEGIYFSPHYHFNPLHRYLDIKPAAGFKQGTFGFRVQVASH